MKVSRVLIMAMALVASSATGCFYKFSIEPTPSIHNPVIDVASDPTLPFQAGFGVEIITPQDREWMAGYDFLRRSNGVHDDLYARAICFKQGDEKLAMVSMDLVGLNRYDVGKIKSMTPGFRPDQILIACTHVHAGPDTMGLWGLPPFYSGRDEDYMELVFEATVDAILGAEAAAVEVSAWTAVYQMDPDLMYNMNEGEPKDDTMGLMVFKDLADDVVATLINLTGHPEVLWENNKMISADFPGVMYDAVESKYGGGAMMFNGALGSLISPNVETPFAERDFDDVEQMGLKMATEVDKGMSLLTREKSPSIVHQTSLILVPVENPIYVVLQEFGMIERRVFDGPALMTEVNLIEIGSAQFVTFPGEAYPKQGLNIRAHQKPNSFQIALANDELGYILYPEDYYSELYAYEAGLCPGPELAVEIENALLELLKSE